MTTTPPCGTDPAAHRFRLLFGRWPARRELALFTASRAALALGTPARSRRAVARLIARP